MREEASGAFPSRDCACAGAGPSYWSTTARCRAGERLFKHPARAFRSKALRRLRDSDMAKTAPPWTALLQGLRTHGLSGVRLVISEQPGRRSLAAAAPSMPQRGDWAHMLFNLGAERGTTAVVVFLSSQATGHSGGMPRKRGRHDYGLARPFRSDGFRQAARQDRGNRLTATRILSHE
jgi:hypothetical protein